MIDLTHDLTDNLRDVAEQSRLVEQRRAEIVDAALTDPPDDDELLVALYDDLRDTGVRFFDRWKLAGLPNRSELTARIRHATKHAQNTRHGWKGTVDESRISYPSPPVGTAVVYTLADSNGHPIYVGHTTRFRLRLGEHMARGRTFSTWSANPGTTADEARLIHALRPIENRVYPRLSVTQSDDAFRRQSVTVSGDTSPCG